MISDTIVRGLRWLCQGYIFCRDTRVMNLPMYDIILGADWLEEQGPMWIDWKSKIMKFQAGGKKVTLTGVKDNTSICPLVSETKLKGLLRKNVVSHWVELSVISDVEQPHPRAGSGNIPKAVQDLLEEFHFLFDVPQSLPPRRAVDHQIVLIPGAQSINVRPYRYSPLWKSEIEKQVKEMLQAGVIRMISSPFASLVLLVKKKDGSWPFCVDYRALNSITVKNKHPLPVVEEFVKKGVSVCVVQ
jgi:hypothetical protein